MQRTFLLILVIGSVFVWFTSSDLPPVVASHFGPGGAANGFMNKSTYTAFMLAVIVAVPALIGFSAMFVRILPTRLINLPHREYWLAPERRAETLESLSSMSLVFASVLVVFMCFVHWLVIQANATQPATLSPGPLLGGLGALGVVTVLWLVALFRRFSRVPER